MARLGVGDKAPLFTLAGTGGKSYSLADYSGKPVVLVFYPGDATPVCTVQLRSYNKGIDEFSNLDATVLGLSPQDVDSKEKWNAAENFAFPLLYDVGKAVGEQYGILGPLGFYRRSVFVIDSNGIISYARRNLTNATFVSAGSLLDAIKQVS